MFHSHKKTGEKLPVSSVKDRYEPIAQQQCRIFVAWKGEPRRRQMTYCSPIVRLLFVYCSSIVRLGPLFFHNILNIEEQEKRLPEVQFTDNAIDNFLAYVDHIM